MAVSKSEIVRFTCLKAIGCFAMITIDQSVCGYGHTSRENGSATWKTSAPYIIHRKDISPWNLNQIPWVNTYGYWGVLFSFLGCCVSLIGALSLIPGVIVWGKVGRRRFGVLFTASVCIQILNYLLNKYSLVSRIWWLLNGNSLSTYMKIWHRILLFFNEKGWKRRVLAASLSKLLVTTNNTRHFLMISVFI